VTLHVAMLFESPMTHTKCRKYNPPLYLISPCQQPVTALSLLYTTAVSTVTAVTAGWSFVLVLG